MKRSDRIDLLRPVKQPLLTPRSRVDKLDDMTTKEKVLQAVQNLPDDASVEEAMERLLLLAKIDRGLAQADAGQTIPHAQLKERMAKWLK